MKIPSSRLLRVRRLACGKLSSVRDGFTILEIMIATAILTLGLVGILALFPVAIRTGKQVVETSTAVVVAESVAEAIREGLHNSLRYVTRGNATHTYFVFKHDGVTDPIPGRREMERPDKDYYILLPRYRPGREGTFNNRDYSLRVAKTFVYPETDANANGNGDAFIADDDGDDQRTELSSGENVAGIRVEKTYRLGSLFPDTNALPSEKVLDDQRIDELKQYSFAFAIRASYWDANLSLTEPPFQPGNRLYNVKVMVFRGFPEQVSTDVKAPEPVFEFDFEVSV